MRKKLTRTRAKKRGRKIASAAAEINTRYAGVFKELSSEHPATPEFEKIMEELIKRRANVYRKLAE
jgi:hypothetical protein